MLFARPESTVPMSQPSAWRLTRTKGENMWWAIGIGGVVYVILVFTLGLMTLRNGHGWMFFFGLFFPVLWIFGAFMRPPEAAVRGG